MDVASSQNNLLGVHISTERNHGLRFGLLIGFSSLFSYIRYESPKNKNITYVPAIIVLHFLNSLHLPFTSHHHCPSKISLWLANNLLKFHWNHILQSILTKVIPKQNFLPFRSKSQDYQIFWHALFTIFKILTQLRLLSKRVTLFSGHQSQSGWTAGGFFAHYWASSQTLSNFSKRKD